MEEIELSSYLTEKEFKHLISTSDYIVLNYEVIEDKPEGVISELVKIVKRIPVKEILPNYYEKRNDKRRDGTTNNFYYLKKEKTKEFMSSFKKDINYSVMYELTKENPNYIIYSGKERKKEKEKISSELRNSRYLSYYLNDRFDVSLLDIEYAMSLVEDSITIKQLILLDLKTPVHIFNNFSFVDYNKEITQFEAMRIRYCLLNKNYVDISQDETHFFNRFKFKKTDIEKGNSNQVNFTGSPTEAMELIKSLIVSGKIIGTQKEIVEQFRKFFNIEINNHDKLIQDIKKRNNGSETLFLNKLKDSLNQFIAK